MDGNRVYRRAKLADREGVLDIYPNITRGRDYLPTIYNDVIQSEDMGYVCDDDGKISGFVMLYLVDGGETAVGRSARVRNSQQGQGILRNLLDLLHSDMLTIPSIKYSVMTVEDVDLDRTKGFLERRKYSQIMAMRTYEYSFNICEIPVIKPNTDIILKEVDVELISAILKSKTSCSYLFPEGFVRVHTVPYQLLETNIKHFIRVGTYIVASFEKHNKILDSEVIDLNKHAVRFMTLASFFPCKAGLAYQIDIFGTKTEDFPSHLAFHTAKMRSLTENKVSSAIMTPLDLNFEEINTHLKMNGIARGLAFQYNFCVFRRSVK